MGNEITPFDAVFTGTQQLLLKFLFGQPDREYGLMELIDYASIGRGTIQRTLERMVDAGLVVVHERGRQKYYQANREADLFKDLVNITRLMLKIDPTDELPEYDQENLAVASRFGISQSALMSLVERFHIKRVSVFGSPGHEEPQSDSQVDLLIEFRTGKAPSMVGMVIVQNAFSDLFNRRRVNLLKPTVLKNSYRRISLEKDLQELYVA